MAGPAAWLSSLLAYTQEHFWVTLITVFLVALTLFWWSSTSSTPPGQLKYEPFQCGDITLETLAKYTGHDPFLPVYFAVRGKVYDVTQGREFYGPGGGYELFAGKEVSRALGKMSLKAEDCCGKLDDLSERELQILKDWEEKFDGKYSVVGRVVPMKTLSLKELAAHNGSDPEKPIYLSIKGTVFDVTTGKQYYGPDGMYPFAGRECARAFALFSTETEDCSGDLEGLDPAELDALRDWEARFYSKYPIVGTISG